MSGWVGVGEATLVGASALVAKLLENDSKAGNSNSSSSNWCYCCRCSIGFSFRMM